VEKSFYFISNISEQNIGGIAMSRYLSIWAPDPNKWPTDPKEDAKLRSESMEWVKQSISKGLITSWGAFIAGGKGYAVLEGSAPQVFKEINKFNPYFKNEIHEVISIDEMPKP
jgi:hypothetical protein